MRYVIRSLEFFETGCPVEGEIGDIVGLAAGDAGDRIWCTATVSAHNIIATGMEGDGMIVSLFSDFGCTALITEFETDSCKVIPLDVSKMSFVRKSLGTPLREDILINLLWKDCHQCRKNFAKMKATSALAPSGPWPAFPEIKLAEWSAYALLMPEGRCRGSGGEVGRVCDWGRLRHW